MSRESGTITIALKVDASLRWGSRTVVDNHASAYAPSAAESTPRDNESSADVIVLSGAVYSVTMTAPDRVQVGGATGQKGATLTDRYGNPARDDTVVAFAADLGHVDPVVVRTEDGVAETTFTSGTEAGTSTVSAITVDERGASAHIRLVPGPAVSLALASSTSSMTVGGQTAVITATLEDQYQNGIPGTEVAFDTDIGLLSEALVRTGSSGWATVTLRSSVHSGIAHVEARSGLLTPFLEIPFTPEEVAGVNLALEDGRISLGESTLAEASVFDKFGNAVPGASVRFESTGRVDLPRVRDCRRRRPSSSQRARHGTGSRGGCAPSWAPAATRALFGSSPGAPSSRWHRSRRGDGGEAGRRGGRTAGRRDGGASGRLDASAAERLAPCTPPHGDYSGVYSAPLTTTRVATSVCSLKVAETEQYFSSESATDRATAFGSTPSPVTS